MPISKNVAKMAVGQYDWGMARHVMGSRTYFLHQVGLGVAVGVRCGEGGGGEVGWGGVVAGQAAAFGAGQPAAYLLPGPGTSRIRGSGGAAGQARQRQRTGA